MTIDHLFKFPVLKSPSLNQPRSQEKRTFEISVVIVLISQ